MGAGPIPPFEPPSIPPAPLARSAPWPFATWDGTDLLLTFFAPLGMTYFAEIVLLGVFGLRGGGIGVLVTALQEVAIAAVPLYWVRAHDGSVRPLGLARGWTARDVGAGVAAGFGAVLAGSIIIALTREAVRTVTGDLPDVGDPLRTFGTSWIAWSAALAVFVAPFAEEILFRGFLFGGLRRRFRAGWAMLISGAVFGVIHGSAVRFVGLAAMGVILAAVYERRRTLAASIAAHFTINLIAVLSFLATRGVR